VTGKTITAAGRVKGPKAKSLTAMMLEITRPATKSPTSSVRGNEGIAGFERMVSLRERFAPPRAELRGLRIAVG
jgi:hypothetical protein